MVGNSNLNPNEQYFVNNANNDWRSQHEPNLRNEVISFMIQRFKIIFPDIINEITDSVLNFEKKTYGTATDKDDYTQQIMERILEMETTARYFHYTLEPAAQELLSQQQQPQNTNCMCQHHVNQQLLYEPICHGNLRPPQMQQPIQQQFPHPKSFPSIQHPVARFSTVSSSSTSGQQNSQFLSRSQLSELRFYAGFRQEQKQEEQEKLITQVMSGPNTQHNHLTTWHNNGEHQGAFRVSSSQQSNTASFRRMAHKNNNLQNMHQQRLSFHSHNNASAFPSEQQRNIPYGESGYVNMYGSSFLGTQGQDLGQSQPVMCQAQHMEQLPHQYRSSQQHLDESQRFQAAGSLRLTQNRVDQQNQSHPLQSVTPANPSTFQDSAGETVNASGGDWKEETYQKIKALKEKSLPFLSALLQNFVEKLQEVDSLPRQEGENLTMGKWAVEQAIKLLNVHRSRVSEEIRDKFATFEEQLGNWTRNKTEPLNPVQQQQGQSPPSPAQLVDQEILPALVNQTGTSTQSGGSPLTSFAPFPVLGDPENTMSSVFHSHQFQTAAQSQEQPACTLSPVPIAEDSIDRMLRELRSPSQASASEMSSVIRFAAEISARSLTESEANSTTSSGYKVNKIEPGSALLKEIYETNERLMETFVEICDEDVYIPEVTSGTIVTCSYNPVLCATLKALYESGQLAPIKPLSLLILGNYPYSYPIPLKTSGLELEDLSWRTRSRFDMCLKDLSKPLYLKELAQMWEDCARATMVEYTARYCGCTCSSSMVLERTVRRAS